MQIFNEFVKSFLKIWKDQELRLLSTSLSFVTVLSIVPLMAISLAVFKWVGGVYILITQIKPMFIYWFSVGAGEQVSKSIDEVFNGLQGNTLSIFGLIMFLLAAVKLPRDLDRAVQKIWGKHEKRSWKKSSFQYPLVLLLGPCILAVILGILSSSLFSNLKVISIFSTQALLIILFLFWIYRFVPIAKVKNRYAFTSAAVITIGILTAEVIYAIVVKKLFHYNEIYGSLAALPTFLIWIQLSWTLLLSGVVLTRTLQKK